MTASLLFSLLSFAAFFKAFSCAQSFNSDAVCKSKIFCYECDSASEPLCADPFNMTNRPPLPLLECFGCCVKLVQWREDLQKTTVFRSCSGNRRLEIEPHLIDRICLRQWDNKGSLCFCEKDRCNGAPGTTKLKLMVLTVLTTLKCFTFFHP